MLLPAWQIQSKRFRHDDRVFAEPLRSLVEINFMHSKCLKIDVESLGCAGDKAAIE